MLYSTGCRSSAIMWYWDRAEALFIFGKGSRSFFFFFVQGGEALYLFLVQGAEALYLFLVQSAEALYLFLVHKIKADSTSAANGQAGCRSSAH